MNCHESVLIFGWLDKCAAHDVLEMIRNLKDNMYHIKLLVNGNGLYIDKANRGEIFITHILLLYNKCQYKAKS